MICPMALPKFSKPKTFHVDYCGCTAATSLLDESSIRYAINLIRQVKPKREFVKTNISVSKDGVHIIYDNDQKYATHVPSSMIAGSNIGKSSLHDTIGVVYISPLTGRHYPAFVHVYRCDSSRTAQKLLARLRAYTLIESHRLQLVQLEQQLIDNNLLNLNHYNTSKLQSQSPNTTLNSTQTNTVISSSSTSSDSRQDKIDPVKSITEEFKKKIDSQEPILFPPKDYDTAHVAHGNIDRAQSWKSTEPTIVGYTPINSENSRARRQTPAAHPSSSNNSTTDELKKSELNNVVIANNGRTRFSTQRSDTTVDPLETVSLAFDFLKDETGSILTDNDGNIEHLEPEQDKPPVFRFRPAQVTGITKKLFTRNNNYELSNSYHQSHSSSKNDLNDYYNNTHYQHQQMPAGYRTRSETNLHYDPQSGMHLSPRYESRLANGSGAPISTNPLWTSVTPTTIGSQPNLLTPQGSIVQAHVRRHLSPLTERRMTSVPLQHPLYASYPNNKPSVMIQQQENEQKRPAPPPPPLTPTNSNKKQTTQLQYLDTHEFILRASDGQLLKNSQYPSRPTPAISRDYRPHSINVNGNSSTMLDVYY